MTKLIPFFLLILGAVASNAQTALKTSAFNSGSSLTQSASYKVNGTIGQSANGRATSNTYSLSSGFQAMIISNPFPDLHFSVAPEINPTTVGPGAKTAITFTVRNIGNAPVSVPVPVKVFLSDNTVFEPGIDVELSPAFSVGTGLPAGSSIAFPATGQTNEVTIPAATTIKSYQLLVVIDPAGTIGETREDNNVGARALTVATGGGADIQPPTIGVPSDLIFADGKTINIPVSDNQSGVKTVRFFRRRIASAEAFVPETAVLSSGSAAVTLAASWADEMGVEGYFVAEDNAGNTSEGPGTKYFWYKENNPAAAIPFAAEFGGSKKSYKMFSIPYALESNAINVVFDELGAYDKSKWRVYRYQNGRYVENENGLFNIDPGKAYWVNMKTKTEIKPGEGKVVPANQSSDFTLAVQQGWNQIGSPFPFTVDWTEVQETNASVVVLGDAQSFASGGYLRTTVLLPWEGVFVFADKAGTIRIPVLTKTDRASRIMQPEWRPTLDQPIWKLPLTLSHGEMQHTSSIGMHPDASLSKDRYDQIVVPRFGDYLEMNTYHKEFFAPHFSEDVVPTAGDHSWTFSVSSSIRAGRATLSWDADQIDEMDPNLIMIDMKDNVMIDMKAVASYAFQWAEDREFRIIYSQAREFMQSAVMQLGHAYPNPFSNGLTVPVFTENAGEAMDLHVYDALGKKVTQLSSRFEKPGLNFIYWDGADPTGGSVSAGLLYYQVGASSGKLSQPRRLMKQ